MRKAISVIFAIAAAIVISASVPSPKPAVAASDLTIERNVDAALARLYAQSPQAKALGDRAKGILVFPRVFRAGILFGGHYGEGALRVGGATFGYYDTTAVSYGLQIGAQYYGYALFFMSDSALQYIEQSQGWEIGTGPTVVLVDQGMASSMTTTTMNGDIYAFTFGQTGLMAGIGLQGSKINRFQP